MGSVARYLADAGDATDVSRTTSLQQANFRPVRKRLVIDLNNAGIDRIDNIEAPAWGPILQDGRRTIVLASDDNFAVNQANQFLAFAVNEH